MNAGSAPTCPVCERKPCQCPVGRPTPRQVARVAAIGRDTLAIVQAAAQAGHTVTSDVINGRLVLVEQFNDTD